MNKTILMQALVSSQKSTFFWSLALFLITFMVVALFDSVAKQYADVFTEIPAGFEAIVGQVGSFSTAEGWLGVELFSMVLPVSLAIIGIGAGASMIGREEKSGTLELLLASPVSRRRIMLEKVGAIAIQLAIVSLSVLAGVVSAMALFPFEISLLNVLYSLLSGWLLGILFAALTLAIQSVTHSRGVALGAGSGVLLVAYFANTLAPMVKDFENIKLVSPFYYYEGQDVLINGLSIGNVMVLVVAAVVLLAIGLVASQRRDTGV